MSLRIAPPASHPTSTTNTKTSKLATTSQSSASVAPDRGAPSAPGIHDTLRSSLNSSTTTAGGGTSSAHPLEARLAQWTATQHSLHQSLLRRTYGIAAPLRRDMELSLVAAGDFRPAALSCGRSSSVHEDILMGRDTSLDWEDVYCDDAKVLGGDGDGSGMGLHEEMERRVGMGKW